MIERSCYGEVDRDEKLIDVTVIDNKLIEMNVCVREREFDECERDKLIEIS